MSLPDDLVDRVKLAAGGDGHVSAYVAAALTAYVDRESLADILADWDRKTPASDNDRRRVDAELERVGLRPAPRRHHAVVTSDPDYVARVDPDLPVIRV